MQLLPVLDLWGGVVVHARGGQRDSYLPLNSPFAPNSSPLQVVAGLLQWCRFQQLYIADLNAIMGDGNNHFMIAAIARSYPDLELWVDGGTARHEAVAQLFALGVARPVVGTETLPDLESWQALQSSWPEQLALSMDHRRGAFLGPAGLDRQPELWPGTVIAMSLDQIGSQQGPDWSLLERLGQRSLRKRISLLAAGGVRCLEDLKQLAAWGVEGVLLASALHDGSLNPAELQQML
ncbi:HisA/HisF-related TIM barrel protein [Nitrosococcus oceani]|uniref:Histidine biosynthesis n=2 Tax=Nitrosococcus oceani TaxID=1229 RepID=Q3JEF8_NITOC|nr:HisA/HisF-related TIM barrel protein [Nitrosococcus oceani]KFI20741.1 nickel transporter [Nitrosococcus oceani C-27]ABA56788.1 Histidine biosynthesis [Nitrosococcus oceani ATCC 19707]EDZ65682.1 Histidine biosynthesis protein [Nitrosococcus oceani AFC27]KFI23812.1 nickel transporter [Nitrosococcus oceani]GEM20544.1 nickel transporter [Nitrosococcus oceani]